MNEKKMGGLPSDGREKYECESKYNRSARNCQWGEAIYIFFLIILSFVLMALNFNNYISGLFGGHGENIESLRKIIFCMISGLLGGAVFDM